MIIVLEILLQLREDSRLQITFDPDANAAYITVLDGPSETQIHSISTPGDLGEIILDFDKSGKLLGIEVLNALEVIDKSVLENAPLP